MPRRKRAFTIEVAEVVQDRDYFGNLVNKTGPYRPVRVAGWAVVKVEEQQGESVLRTIDQLEVYSPEEFHAGSEIRLPKGSVWQVEGNAEDYRHGPWWDPGLVVVRAKKVEG